MIQLSTFDESKVFYYGTIVVMRDMHTDCNGKKDDLRYCMISDSNDRDNDFRMVDLYHSIGSAILHDLKPNLEGHHGVDKNAIKEWVRMYFKLFYQKEWFQNTITDDKLNEIIFIEDLFEYFTRVNRNIKVS